jgi:WD40 repeat protein
MDDISVKINDDANKIEIEVDKIDVDKIDVAKIDFDKIFTFDDINDERHNGEPITMIEISPNENYLITYSKEDGSIVGWDVENLDKVQFKFHQTVKINKTISNFCVSDDKKLVHIFSK